MQNLTLVGQTKSISKTDNLVPFPTISERDSLKNFAYRVAGPRDFVLNLVVNAAIPWWITKGMVFVPLFGATSIFSLLAPMGFILVGATSFFGFFNGLTKGKVNKETLIYRFKTNPSWLIPTLLTSLAFGIIGGLTFILILSFIYSSFPPVIVSREKMIIGQSLLAAFLAYFVQVFALLNAKNLKIQKVKMVEAI
ncbi:MAG: hypothetical protein SFU25_09680 [Candidatus Caenarcaniphilales bacterium]|nr:hypothetical protein [Candidatus Caenarcaniphilales bacterium]